MVLDIILAGYSETRYLLDGFAALLECGNKTEVAAGGSPQSSANWWGKKDLHCKNKEGLT